VSWGGVAFAAIAANPIGGLPVAIPFAIFKLHYPAWLAAVSGVPFAYLQVLAVDASWSRLERTSWWLPFLERRRGRWAERLMASNGGFWVSFFSTYLGPWATMAFARYAKVPQRKVAPPILCALLTCAAVVAAGCGVFTK
jgi:hypothetical protein